MKRTGIAVLALLALAGCGTTQHAPRGAVLESQVAACQAAWEASYEKSMVDIGVYAYASPADPVADESACTDRVAAEVLKRQDERLGIDGPVCEAALKNPDVSSDEVAIACRGSK